MTGDQRVVFACLSGVAVSLLVVGLVSGTLIRHVIQVFPLFLAGVVVAWRPGWGAYAAMPVFLFWAFVVVLIWLYLGGMSSIANGHYTPIEIVLTVFMALFCLGGVWKSTRLGRTLAPSQRLGAFVVFGTLQPAAMRISLLESFGNQ